MKTTCEWAGCTARAEYIATQKVGKQQTLACCESHRPGGADLSHLSPAQRRAVDSLTGGAEAPSGRSYELRFYSVRYIGA